MGLLLVLQARLLFGCLLHHAVVKGGELWLGSVRSKVDHDVLIELLGHWVVPASVLTQTALIR